VLLTLEFPDLSDFDDARLEWRRLLTLGLVSTILGTAFLRPERGCALGGRSRRGWRDNLEPEALELAEWKVARPDSRVDWKHLTTHASDLRPVPSTPEKATASVQP
jgi:hypothetical protein